MPDSHASVAVEPARIPDPPDTASFGRDPSVKRNGNAKKLRAVTATSAPVKRKMEDVEVNTRETPSPVLMAGSLDEYREGCLKLEKARHARVFEAEKRRLYVENSIESAYQHTVQAVLEDAMHSFKMIKVKLLYENMEKTRGVQELLYKIIRDEGAWPRRHEMALRGRGSGEVVEGKGRSLLEEDGVLLELERERDKDKDKNNRRSRKNESRHKVKVYLEVDEAEAADDLAEIRGEKRAHEGDNGPERRSKKRK